MATRAAARAPASAAALPPPGVGLGPASSWIQASRPGPPLSRIFDSSRWSITSEHLSHAAAAPMTARSEEHTSELQSQSNLVCRLLLEKKKKLRGERLPRGAPA